MDSRYLSWASKRCLNAQETTKQEDKDKEKHKMKDQDKDEMKEKKKRQECLTSSNHNDAQAPRVTYSMKHHPEDAM